jgi:molecular chaperone DnaJ
MDPRGQRQNAGRGADLRYDLEMTLEEAFAGANKTITIEALARCEGCEGRGSRGESRAQRCGTCGGAGKVRAQQGFFVVERGCPTCLGSGETIADPCPACDGEGRSIKRRKINVDIPAGVDDGTRLRLTGEGEAGISGGPNGDLYVVINVRRHELFEREGPDLHCQVPITMVQAALGAEIDAPTLEGKVKLKIPEGTQSGKVMRLKGRGLPTLRSGARGDQLLHIFVETPSRLTSSQRELLERFAEESDVKVSPANKGFLDKLRELFD